MLYINPLEVFELEVVINALGGSGVAYGRPCGNFSDRVSPDDRVFIPQGVASKFAMCPGDTFRIRVVPNNPDMQHLTQWRCIYVFPPAGYVQPPRVEMVPVPPPAAPPAPVPPPKPKLNDSQLRGAVEATSLDGRVWTTREVFFDILGKEPDHKDREEHRVFALIGNHLRSLRKDGELFASEIFCKGDQAHAVYFCTDMDKLVPEGY